MAYDYSRRYNICISEYSSYYARVIEPKDYDWKKKSEKIYITYIYSFIYFI